MIYLLLSYGITGDVVVEVDEGATVVVVGVEVTAAGTALGDVEDDVTAVPDDFDLEFKVVTIPSTEVAEQ